MNIETKVEVIFFLFEKHFIKFEIMHELINII